jgi:hypothetical protein
MFNFFQLPKEFKASETRKSPELVPQMKRINQILQGVTNEVLRSPKISFDNQFVGHNLALK